MMRHLGSGKVGFAPTQRRRAQSSWREPGEGLWGLEQGKIG